MQGIHVCFSIHDKKGDYSKYLGVALVSMLENSSGSVNIHIIMDDTITEKNKERFLDLQKKYECSVFLYEIDKKMLERFNSVTRMYSIGTLFRFYVADVIPTSIERVIYLDDDIVVNTDIVKLWDMDLEGNDIAACHDVGVYDNKFVPGPCNDGDVSKYDYFNQGVLILDLEKIRAKGDFLHLCMNLLVKHPNYTMLDQDVFNVIFNRRVKYIPTEFNMFTREIRKKEIGRFSCIIHYSADSINPDRKCWVDDDFFKYLGISPWGCSEESFPYFFSIIDKKNLVIESLSNLISIINEGERKILVWGAKSVLIKSLDEIFNLNKCVFAYIDSNSQLEGKEVLGRKVYAPSLLNDTLVDNAFIIVASKKGYNEIKLELENKGKVENIDFIDARSLIVK